MGTLEVWRHSSDVTYFNCLTRREKKFLSSTEIKKFDWFCAHLYRERFLFVFLLISHCLDDCDEFIFTKESLFLLTWHYLADCDDTWWRGSHLWCPEKLSKTWNLVWREKRKRNWRNHLLWFMILELMITFAQSDITWQFFCHCRYVGWVPERGGKHECMTRFNGAYLQDKWAKVISSWGLVSISSS